VRRSPWYEYARARAGLDFIVAYLHLQGTFEDIPRLIVTVVHMKRGNQASRAWRAASIAPLGDHESIVDRTHDLPRERRRNER
jgi:hypothetical protein